MHSPHRFLTRVVVRRAVVALMAACAMPAFAQTDLKAIVVKHLQISRDFTLKAAVQSARLS